MIYLSCYFSYLCSFACYIEGPGSGIGFWRFERVEHKIPIAYLFSVDLSFYFMF